MEPINELEIITSHIGGMNEFNILRDWVVNSCPKEELENWDKAIKSGESLIFQTYLAKIAHKYDLSNGLEKRAIDDEVIENILKEKRNITAIINEEEPYFENSEGEKVSIYKFSYTIGNCTQDPPLPELLTFYPYEGSIMRSLNVLSDCLINGTIKSIKENEAIEIFGIIGAGGEMPIRIRMIDKEEIKEVHEQFTTQVPSNQPIILVDIPDTNGYFPEDKEFIENKNNKTYLKNIPKWIKTSYSDETISRLVIDLESLKQTTWEKLKEKTIEAEFKNFKKSKDSEKEKEEDPDNDYFKPAEISDSEREEIMERFKKRSKPKSKFYISDDLFYRISLIGFLLIFGSMIFFIVEYRDKESNKVSALLKTEQVNKFLRDLQSS
tara:strand:- start:13 stop:1155 length:1143 start_codon:yes stop_codon:yes gene_type:complete